MPKTRAERPDKPARLTPRQEAFVREYLVDLNATQAAIRAGYSAKTAEQQGPRLLGNVGVAEAIRTAQAERAERVQVTADWVVGRLVENVERAMQTEPVRDREGNETGEYVYAGAVANKALELLGKHLGLFTDRVDVTSGGKAVAAPPIVVTIVNARRNAACEGAAGEVDDGS